jgi:hypothetical protein
VDEFPRKSKLKMDTRRFFGSLLNGTITHLPPDHHSDYRISHIVIILSEQVAKYEYMLYR